MIDNLHPINSDHAIEQVIFKIIFNRSLLEQDLIALRMKHSAWADELPAVAETQGMNVTVDAVKGFVPTVVAGLDFSYVRPDGTSVWAMHCLGNEISVECSRYTRWEKVWGTAKKLFSEALDALASVPEAMLLRQATLSVVDVFVSADNPTDMSGVLKSSDLIPAHIHTKGADWHVHAGWFEEVGAIRVLNNLNVDAVGDLTKIPGSKDSGGRLRILHTQAVSFENAGEPEAGSPWLASVMPALHDANKSVMNSLIKAEMAKEIGLVVA